MRYAIQFQINLFALSILLILLAFIHTSRIRTFSRQLVDWILLTTAIAIIMEPLTWIFDGKLFFGAYAWEYGTNFVLFLIGPVIGGLLMSYVDYRLFHNPQRLKKRLYYQGASLLTFALLVVNMFIPVYFTVRMQTNSYSSGPFKAFHYLLIGSIYLYCIGFVTKHRKRIPNKEALIYILFFFIPIVGMLLQLINSKLHFSWTSVVLTLLVIYIFLETTPSDEDFLTKLYNRNSFDTHLSFLIQSDKQFGLLMLDLNSFKQINDQYGHVAGDEVLIGFAHALKQVFHPNGLAFRLGGDEFAVIYTSATIEKQIEELRNLLSHHTIAHLTALSFSSGYHVYEPSLTADALTRLADHAMYEQKKVMKKILTEVTPTVGQTT